MKVSMFKNFNRVEQNLELSVILDQIRMGKYKARILHLRELVRQGRMDDYNDQKRSLPGFTPSGLFKGGRKLQHLKEYSGVIVLDLDDLSQDQLVAVRSRVEELKFTYACFISPGGKGLKILVRVFSRPVLHKQAFNQVKDYYERELNVLIDPSGKDVTRLCFVSWDESLYLDPSSATFFHFARDQGIDISTCRSLDRPVIAKSGAASATKRKQPPKVLSPLAKIESYLTTHYHFRYNIVTSKIEYRTAPVKPPHAAAQPFSLRGDPLSRGDEATRFVPVTDYIENSLFRELLSNNLKCQLSSLRTLLHSDFCPRYDPFANYFNSLPPWDEETNYILDLANTVQTTNEKLWQECFKRWLVASVVSVLDSEVVNHTAIIFSGPQGIGKTTWMLNLCPSQLKNYIFSGTINPNNRDTLLQLSECMFINLDELENMTRSEIGTVKEIITKSAIRVRRAYGFHNESLVRRASFMGSVNTAQFLTDTTGSRRFLCFDVRTIDYDVQIDISKVFSQAFALYKSGFKFWFDPEEAQEINRNNEQFLLYSPEEELLLANFSPISLSKARRFLTSSQIISEVSENSSCSLSLNLGSRIRMGLALKKNGFEKRKSNGLHLWAVEVAKRDGVTSSEMF